MSRIPYNDEQYDPVAVDAIRQVRKAYQTLAAVDRHLRAQAEANAALHMAGQVIYSPLSSAVSSRLNDLHQWLVTHDLGDAVDARPQPEEQR